MRILLNANRTGYSVDQIRNTMTVGQLIDYLQQFDEDSRIYLKHDNGYTFGGIGFDDFEEDDDDGDDNDDDSSDACYDESMSLFTVYR